MHPNENVRELEAVHGKGYFMRFAAAAVVADVQMQAKYADDGSIHNFDTVPRSGSAAAALMLAVARLLRKVYASNLSDEALVAIFRECLLKAKGMPGAAVAGWMAATRELEPRIRKAWEQADATFPVEFPPADSELN